MADRHRSQRSKVLAVLGPAVGIGSERETYFEKARNSVPEQRIDTKRIANIPSAPKCSRDNLFLHGDCKRDPFPTKVDSLLQDYVNACDPVADDTRNQ